MTKQTVKDFPILYPMATRIYLEGQAIEANQVWIFRPHYGYARVYIIKEIVNEKKIICFGLAAPLELVDFYRLERVRYLTFLPRELRNKVKFELKRWGLRHLIFDPFGIFVSLVIAILITILLFLLTIPL